jgi:uncharacterized membrane protein YeiH
MKPAKDNLTFAADVAGTLLFAIEGATAAIQGDLDLLGIIVPAFAMAMGGGITRDVLIGAVPPVVLRDWRYSALVFTVALIVFFLHHTVEGIPRGVLMILDAAGLVFFAVAVAEKALNFQMHPFVAVFLGAITAEGGGTLRDIFLARIPIVLRAEVYATAALLGSACMVAGIRFRFSPTASAILGGSICFLLRVVSVWRH